MFDVVFLSIFEETEKFLYNVLTNYIIIDKIIMKIKSIFVDSKKNLENQIPLLKS